MVENLVTSSLDEELMELPYFKRVNKAREEGIDEGLEQGLTRGLEQGLRHSVVNVVRTRFGPDATFQARLSSYLETQKGLDVLDQLLVAVTRADSLESVAALIADDADGGV